MIDKDCKYYFNKLGVVAKSIEPNKITLLTGRNGGGKSLIRQLLNTSIASKLGKDKVVIPHASQQIRTTNNPSLSSMSRFASDLDWLATSSNTINTIKSALNVKADYVVIDEPEIGLGEELQLGLIEWLNKELTGRGALVICHSRLIAKNLNFDLFINLEDMTFDEWINRQPVSISIDEFELFSDNMHELVRTRLNSRQ